MEDNNEKIPQNIQALIGEIGEKMVLFKLYVLTHFDPNLEIFKNYSDKGYDIGLKNTNSGKKVRIEVKTRQHLVSTANKNSLNSCHFTLTEKEYENSDFLIGYWLEYNDFFIVPIINLVQTKNGIDRNSNPKYVYKHIVNRLKKGDALYSLNSMPYLNDWESIKKLLLYVQK